MSPKTLPSESWPAVPARNLRGKVPKLGEHCPGGGRGEKGDTTLTGADELYNDEAFRAKAGRLNRFLVS
jgi:hypothetical protein